MPAKCEKCHEDGCCESWKVQAGRSRVRIPVPTKDNTLELLVDDQSYHIVVELCSNFELLQTLLPEPWAHPRIILVPSTLECSCDRSCCCFRGFRKSAASDFLPQSNKTGAVHFVRMASVRKGCRALTSWFLLSLYYSMVSWNNGIVPGPFQYPGLQTVELTFYHLSGIAGIKVKILKHGPFPAYFSLFWSFLLYN